MTEAIQTIALIITFRKCNKNWLEPPSGAHLSSRKKTLIKPRKLCPYIWSLCRNVLCVDKDHVIKNIQLKCLAFKIVAVKTSVLNCNNNDFTLIFAKEDNRQILTEINASQSIFFFYVLLTVYLGIIFLNNYLDAQFFFTYVYFYSLHVSGSHVPIIRIINCINTTSGICHSVQSDIYQMSYWYN